MNALTKFSIALLLATATAIYLYVSPDDEGFDVARLQSARSQPQDAICKQDGERLLQLQAKASLVEVLTFAGEIRCLQLWPQLQTLMDRLSNSSRSTASSSLDQAASGATPASDAAAALGGASAALDAACRHDEHRLAELRANPSVDAAVRFDSELKCPRLQPQLPAILKQLSQVAGTNPMGAARDATSDGACKTDEDRLAKLQANPSVDEAARLESELTCAKLQPQLLAILDGLSKSLRPAGAQPPNGAPHSAGAAGANSATEAAPPASAPPASEATSNIEAPSSIETPNKTAGTGETAPQASTTPTSDVPAIVEAPSSNDPPPNTMSSERASAPQAPSTTSDDACTQDEERLARLRAAPSDEEVARFTQELRCEALRPELLSLTAALAKPSVPASASVPQDTGAATDTGAGPNAANETQPAPQVAAEAERRIAALESEKEALAAKVSQLEHDREASSADEARSAPPPAARAERSETQPSSQTAANAERRIAELEGEKEALTAEVSQLQHQREALPDETASTQAPTPAAPAKRSESESAAALASLPDGMQARVLIRYHSNSADARAQAEKLANAFKRQGIEVADLRESASALRTELSFAYAPDETIAQQVGRLVGVAPMRRLQPKDGLMVRPGTVELNLSGESNLAAIKATSSRESDHE